MEKSRHFWDKEIRPRFSFETHHSLKEISDNISLATHRQGAPCKARIVHDHIVLYFPADKQHYWSPQLSLSIEENNKGSLVRGLYGPRPSVWTMFVFFYSSIGFALLFLLIFAASYISLGKPAHMLWLAPVLILILFSLFRVSSQGQKLARDEMTTLHNFLRDCLQE